MPLLTWKLREILIVLSNYMKIVLHVSDQLLSLASLPYFFKAGEFGMEIILSGCTWSFAIERCYKKYLFYIYLKKKKIPLYFYIRTCFLNTDFKYHFFYGPYLLEGENKAKQKSTWSLVLEHSLCKTTESDE